jgi:hypothetical protein
MVDGRVEACTLDEGKRRNIYRGLKIAETG